MKNLLIIFFTVLFLLNPHTSFCDVVWPALYFEGSLLTWWVIALGLVIELPFYYFTVNKILIKSLHAVLISNAISAVIGIVLIPLLGIIWEIFPGIIMYKFFNIGTFNPVTYIATFFLAIVSNAIIEFLALRGIYKITFVRKKCLLIFMANLLSVSIALIPVFSKYGNIFMK